MYFLFLMIFFLSFFLFFLRLFIYSRETTERSRGIDRGRNRFPAWSLMWDLIPGPQFHNLSRRQMLNHRTTKVPPKVFFIVNYTTTCSTVQIKYFGVVGESSFSYSPHPRSHDLASFANPNPIIYPKFIYFFLPLGLPPQSELSNSFFPIYHNNLGMVSLLLLLLWIPFSICEHCFKSHA